MIIGIVAWLQCAPNARRRSARGDIKSIAFTPGITTKIVADATAMAEAAASHVWDGYNDCRSAVLGAVNHSAESGSHWSILSKQ